jgi:hypothetical protein
MDNQLQFELQIELQRLSTIYQRFLTNDTLSESLFFELYKYLLTNSKIFMTIIHSRLEKNFPTHLLLEKFTMQEIQIIIYVHVLLCNFIITFITKKSKTNVYTKDGVCISNIKLYLYNLYQKYSSKNILDYILYNSEYYKWLNCEYFCLFDDDKNGNIIFEVSVEKLFTPFNIEFEIGSSVDNNLIMIKWISFVKNLQNRNKLR